MKPRSMLHKTVFWGLALILLTGIMLRLALVNVHGLDGDETFSMGLAQGSLGDLLRHFADDQLDVHPKLHFVLLHVWINLTGTSQAGLRLSSVLADALLGAVLMALARRLFGTRPALIAGLLWSINPLLIWATQQTRMYALLALLAGTAWLCLLHALNTSRPVWWIAFALAALGAGYSHIIGAVAIAASGAAILAWAVFGSGTLRARLAGVIALGVVGLAYLPYAWTMWQRRGDHSPIAERAPETLGAFVRRFGSGLLVHQPPLSDGWLWAILAVCVILLIWAFVAGPRRPLMAAALLMLVTAGAGMAWFALSNDIFKTKFFAYVVPLFVLGLGVGVSAIPTRWGRGVVLAGLLAASLVGLAYQLDPTARDDFPAAARFIEQYGDAGDVVIVVSNYGEPTFMFYYEGDSTVIAPWYSVNRDMPLDDLLPFVTEGYDTVWLALFVPHLGDPEGALQGWFQDRYPLRTEVFPTTVTVKGYDLRPKTDHLPPEAVPLDITFGGRVVLRGFQVVADSVARRDYRLHPPSGWVHVTLYWEVLAPDTTFQPEVRIEGPSGEVYSGQLTRGSDTFAHVPPATWQPGQVWRSDVDLNLNPDMPTGEAKVVVRVMGPDGAFWPVDGTPDNQNWLIVDRVHITR
ncbi:MAG: glycosyltransferase family 39 protein [Anaerolineae bacterium]|nr:glycosyltransferase family 39 protein [Anaerolineae bacterium]